MKFYKDGFHENFYSRKINALKLNSVYNSSFTVWFCKYGIFHNNKNASYISNGYKGFYLNNKLYGNQDDFTKQSWRKFVKLQVFL